MPAASLLFQAPDPARAKRRRRKVTAATQAPETAPLATQPELEAPAKADSEVSATAVETEEASAPAKRRRRKVTAAAQAPEAAPVAAQPERAVSDDAPEDAETEDSLEEAAEEAAEETGRTGRKRRRGGRGRRSRTRSDEATELSAEEAEDEPAAEPEPSEEEDTEPSEGSSRRRRRRRTRTRSERSESRDLRDEIAAPKGSTRLEAKRQRRREGRAAGRRRPIVTESEFLARRESVDRQMIVREQDGLNQIAVLEDGLLVEHYVARHTQTSMVGNVYIGRVQNVLPSMEAAFVDLGKGRNAVLYAGEVNWDAAGMEGKPRRIEEALSSGDTVLVQVTKDPIGHKGARLTSQVTLAGRYLVLIPGGTMTGISRKLPDTERSRLKKILRKVVPDDAGVIVRTAAEGASEEQLAADVQRLVKQWESIDKKAKQVLSGSGKAPVLLKGEPELAVRVVRDVFNEDFKTLIVSGAEAWATISEYVTELSPDLADRLVHWVERDDVFTAHRVDEQLAKGFDRKVWLPSGGTLVIDRTEAMTVIDVNTGRFTGGAGGTLEETVTRNNLEAAEEIVRQLRLRDIGGMVVIDFVDMVLEANRDLVLRRLVECLSRDRTRHQVTEVTSLGLVQMTRKRVGQGLVEAFSTPCDCCGGRGFIVHEDPVENQQVDMSASAARSSGRGRGRKGQEETPASSRKRSGADKTVEVLEPVDDAARAATRDALAQIAAAAEQAHKER
ncbi:Rne/Rng family ribonuclease [Actinomyces bovis]